LFPASTKLQNRKELHLRSSSINGCEKKSQRQSGPDHSVKREEWDRVRFKDLDEGLVSRDRKAIREKIETEPKIRKWFQDLTTINT
jgi:hypothetical protein